MNELKVFTSSEFGELDVMVVDGKEYFPAIKVATILGYTNPRKAIIDHCKGVTKRDVLTNGGNQQVKFIPEGDLYRLIVSSKLPAAEKFERWVFDDVLPSIRKNGGYINNAEELISKTATAVVSEVIKQLLPLIGKSNTSGAWESEAIYEVTPPCRKKLRRASGIISRLDESLRSEVEDMIISERYTYEEIKAFLAEQGVKLSLSAIWRYAKYLYRI